MTFEVVYEQVVNSFVAGFHLSNVRFNQIVSSSPVLRLHSIPSMGIDGPIAAHRISSMGFELSPSTWGTFGAF